MRKSFVFSIISFIIWVFAFLYTLSVVLYISFYTFSYCYESTLYKETNCTVYQPGKLEKELCGDGRESAVCYQAVLPVIYDIDKKISIKSELLLDKSAIEGWIHGHPVNKTFTCYKLKKSNDELNQVISTNLVEKCNDYIFYFRLSSIVIVLELVFIVSFLIFMLINEYIVRRKRVVYRAF